MSLVSTLLGFADQWLRRRVKLRVIPFLATSDGRPVTLGIDVVNMSEFSVFIDTVCVEREEGGSSMQLGDGELKPRQSQLYWFDIMDIDRNRCPTVCVVRTQCHVEERVDLPSEDTWLSLASGAPMQGQPPRPREAP